jgi:hypothetical protein
VTLGTSVIKSVQEKESLSHGIDKDQAGGCTMRFDRRDVLRRKPSNAEVPVAARFPWTEKSLNGVPVA